MRFDNQSLRFKLLVPVIVISSFIFLFVYFLSNKLLDNVIKEYHKYVVEKYTFEIKKILERAITELSVAQLVLREDIVEAKKQDVLEEVKLYWQNNGFQGIIKSSNGIVENTIKNVPIDIVLSKLKEEKNNYFAYKGLHYHIFSVDIPSWDLQILTLANFKDPDSSEKQVRLLFYLLMFAFSILIGSILYITRKNLNPIYNLVKDIKDSKEVRKTNVTELDLIGSNINESFRSLYKKTTQCQTLHSIAISVHEYSSIEDIMAVIVERSINALNSEYGAIVIYDDKGKIKKIRAKGADININTIPEGRGILNLIRLSLTPLRINDVMTHPAFSGSFPEGHPIIKNIIAYPIFSSDGKPIGALYFGNKEGGFTEEDEILLKAVSSDAAIAFQKIENMRDLMKFQKIIESAFDAIIIADYDGMIIYANSAFEKITGYSKEEIIGKNISESIFQDPQSIDDLWRTIREGKTWKEEFINRRKDGEIYYTSTVIFPVHLDNEIHYVAIQRDITHEKKLYEQLLRAQKMEAIGTLAGGIAHDFNNILTAVLGYSEIMMGMIKEGDPFYKPINIIYNAAEKGADLAKKILTITRKEKMEMKPVDINEITKNCVELLQRSIPKNIEIITNLKENIPRFIGDPSQIQQVVMNLAVNARDAMPKGGKLLIETSLVGSENGAANGLPDKQSGFVKLSVSDTGIGMDRETQRKIFDPFFTTKEVGKGTGLGLYIVHSIVSNHKGYINLYSEVGKGTRFNVYLPLIKTIDRDETEQEIDLRGKGTILVIDDEENMRELCKDILEPLGYNVVLSADGSEGIKTFRQIKDEVAIVILDMIMPKMSGSEVFQALRSIKPDAKIILCSGYSHEGFAGIDKLLKSGASGFIQKPFTSKTIATAIKNALGKENI